ncbi:MAG: fibronectin type III domain-containing protein, partial [bacterium]
MNSQNKVTILNHFKAYRGIKLTIILSLIPILLILVLFGISYISEKDISVRDVKITNVTDSSVTVTFLTNELSNPKVIVSETNNFNILNQLSKPTYFDDRTSGDRYTHHITVTGLNPSSKYYYKISTGLKNVETTYPVLETLNTLDTLTSPDPSYGQFPDQTTSDMLIYFSIGDSTINSTYLNSDFAFTFDKTNLRDSTLTKSYSYKTGETIKISTLDSSSTRTIESQVGEDQPIKLPDYIAPDSKSKSEGPNTVLPINALNNSIVQAVSACTPGTETGSERYCAETKNGICCVSKVRKVFKDPQTGAFCIETVVGQDELHDCTADAKSEVGKSTETTTDTKKAESGQLNSASCGVDRVLRKNVSKSCDTSAKFTKGGIEYAGKLVYSNEVCIGGKVTMNAGDAVGEGCNQLTTSQTGGLSAENKKQTTQQEATKLTQVAVSEEAKTQLANVPLITDIDEGNVCVGEKDATRCINGYLTICSEGKSGGKYLCANGCSKDEKLCSENKLSDVKVDCDPNLKCLSSVYSLGSPSSRCNNAGGYTSNCCASGEFIDNQKCVAKSFLSSLPECPTSAPNCIISPVNVSGAIKCVLYSVSYSNVFSCCPNSTVLSADGKVCVDPKLNATECRKGTSYFGVDLSGKKDKEKIQSFSNPTINNMCGGTVKLSTDGSCTLTDFIPCGAEPSCTYNGVKMVVGQTISTKDPGSSIAIKKYTIKGVSGNGSCITNQTTESGITEILCNQAEDAPMCRSTEAQGKCIWDGKKCINKIDPNVPSTQQCQSTKISGATEKKVGDQITEWCCPTTKPWILQKTNDQSLYCATAEEKNEIEKSVASVAVTENKYVCDKASQACRLYDPKNDKGLLPMKESDCLKSCETDKFGLLPNIKFISSVNAQSVMGVVDNSNSTSVKVEGTGIYQINSVAGYTILNKDVRVLDPLDSKIKFFVDTNSNGIMDGSEKYITEPLDVKLEKTSDIKIINLKDGWNLINMNLVSTSVKTANDLLVEIAKQGGYATHLATYRNGKWVMFSQRAGNKFGSDFNLVPTEGYFLRVHKAVTLKVE